MIDAVYQRADEKCSECKEVKGPLMDFSCDDYEQMLCADCLRKAAEILESTPLVYWVMPDPNKNYREGSSELSKMVAAFMRYREKEIFDNISSCRYVENNGYDAHKNFPSIIGKLEYDEELKEI